jgi:DNA-binding response OmpR family regulator
MNGKYLPYPHIMNRILIIDDDADVAIIVRNILEFEHFVVFSASNGKEGIALASQYQPDLVLCDLNMPVTDGYEVLAAIKRDDKLADIPVVFLTGLTERHQVRKGMILGADDYLTKPVDAEDLLKTVHARLLRREEDRKRRAREMEKAVEVLVETLTETSDELMAASQNPTTINQKVHKAWLQAKQKIANQSSLDIADRAKIDSFLAKTPTEKRYIKISEIRRITAYGEYSQVYLNKSQCLLIRKSIKQWSCELPEPQYIQVHRNAIVNLSYLERVEILPDKNLNIHVQGANDPIRVSVRRTSWVNRKLKAFNDHSAN